MKLTKIERLILLNQFLILEKLYANEGYEKHRTIIEQGYTYNYNDLVEWLHDEMSEENCEEVWDILQMHRALKFSFDRLEDKEGLKVGDIEFRGFDGNNETEYMVYTKFIIEDMGRFSELKKEHWNYNSHFPTLQRYRSMLSVWRTIAERNDILSADQIKQIINAS